MTELDRLLGIYSDPVKSWPEQPETWDRDTILPFARRTVPAKPDAPDKWNSSSDVMRSLDAHYGSGWQFAAPQLAVDIADAAKSVGGSPLIGKPFVPSENPEMTESMIGHAGSVVGPMAGVGMGRAAMAPHGGPELGIFGGRLAKTADHAALARAEDMAGQGVPREQIWKDTGWFQGADGKWRFEIDDSSVALNPMFIDRSPSNIGSITMDMPHAGIIGAYPSAGGIEMRVRSGSGGEFHETPHSPGRIVVGRDNVDPRSIALHEVQHGVQRFEDFARGGNETIGHPRAAVERLAKEAYEYAKARVPDGDDALLAELGLEVKRPTISWEELTPRQQMEWWDAGRGRAYRQLAGEVEARAVQARRDLSPDQRRERFPWLDYDVPESQQIVRFGDRGPQMSTSEGPSPLLQPRSIDSLGYYSQALESALRLAQSKGTPEQMLAQMKKAGVKDAEIEATGLGNFLSGKKSVTQDEIMRHLEGNRVGLNEVQYGKGAAKEGFDAIAALRRGEEAPPSQFEGPTKWQDYSLDPSNPTYRETVLHLPESRVADIDARLTELNAEINHLSGGMSRDIPRESLPRFQELRAEAKTLSDERANLKRGNFQSGHFPEPNIVGHMMTSTTRLPFDVAFPSDRLTAIENKIAGSAGVFRMKDMNEAAVQKALQAGAITPDEAAIYTHGMLGGKGADPRPQVFTIDQIQSDWGQQVRDAGETAGMSADALQQRRRDLNIRRFNLEDQLEAIKDKESPDYRRISAELALARDALRATPSDPIVGHPLVNTTDQWTNTTLRRALTQAANEGAEYVAIPSGETVLSYNPGDTHGMNTFYDKIVPKNLGNILSRIDKDARPFRVDQLEAPSGPAGHGFTVFPLSEAARARIKSEGLPLFSNIAPQPVTVEDILNQYYKDEH